MVDRGRKVLLGEQFLAVPADRAPLPRGDRGRYGRYQDRLTRRCRIPRPSFMRVQTTFANGLRKSRSGWAACRDGSATASPPASSMRNWPAIPSAEAAQNQPDTIDVRTPWLEIDDVFFRGTRHGLGAAAFLPAAAEFDFAQVLADKNAEASVRDRSSASSRRASIPLRSPMVMNGGGYGLTANHSLVMANYLARANAAVINLRELLDQG